MSRLLFICPWFGPIPDWFQFFNHTASFNSRFDWLIFSDQNEFPEHAPNIRFEKLTLQELNERARQVSGLNISKDAYSQCDLRPLYARMFDDYTKAYDFWGHCDLDIVWGNLDTFITEESLKESDVISARKERVAGHCTIYRNCEKIHSLFSKMADKLSLLEDSESHVFDENAWSDFLAEQDDLNISWQKRVVAGKEELLNQPWGWQWQDGILQNSLNEEYAYLHFFTWKQQEQTFQFNLANETKKIILNHQGFFQNTMPLSFRTHHRLHDLKKKLRS